jgi:hypothetical protein
MWAVIGVRMIALNESTQIHFDGISLPLLCSSCITNAQEAVGFVPSAGNVTFTEIKMLLLNI